MELYKQQIQQTGRIPAELLPKTKNEALSVLATWPRQYYKTLHPATFSDVFKSITPSIATFRKERGQNGLIATQALLTIIIRDLVRSFNVGQTMDEEQVADLINDIIDQYYWLNIEDFRLCFNNAKAGRYDRNGIFRLDASVILTWLDKYTSERLNAACESSYNEHQSNKFNENAPDLEMTYDKFMKKWKY